MQKQFEKTGIKEEKNFKVSNLVIQTKENRRLTLETANQHFLYHEKGRMLKERNLQELATRCHPAITTEIGKTLEIIGEMKKRCSSNRHELDANFDVKNFIVMCEGYRKYIISYGRNFDVISLRKYRHAIKRALMKILMSNMMGQIAIDDEEYDDAEYDEEEITPRVKVYRR